MIISIDGFAGTGKSSIGRELSKRLEIPHISSGQCYRLITLYAARSKMIIPMSTENLYTILKYLDDKSDDFIQKEVSINADELRSEIITKNVVYFANIPIVRNWVNSFLRKMGELNNIIVDGRDIGTIVFPNADLKLFFTATIEQRIELLGKNLSLKGKNKFQLSLIERDHFDITREIAPLRIPENSIEINTCNKSLSATIDEIEQIIKENTIFCKSRWELNIQGVLSLDVKKECILLSEKPCFENIKELSKPKAIIFRSELNDNSHITMLFNDMCIANVHNVSESITSLIGSKIRIITKNGIGYIQAVKESKESISEIRDKLLSRCVLNSSIEGFKYCKSQGVKIIATRGEFILINISLKYLSEGQSFSNAKLAYSHIYKIIKYGVSNFQEIIYRFTDFSSDTCSMLDSNDLKNLNTNNYTIGERGISLLLERHSEYFNMELKLVNRIFKKNKNISVLLPYVRTSEEAISGYRIISKTFKGKVGCMIEVPSILYYISEIDKIFDFFVVGISDLSQLIQGTSRNLYPIQEKTVLFIAELLKTYFFPYVSDGKSIYITSKKLFDLLKLKYNNMNLIYLSK